MGIRIRSNTAALNAQRHLANATRSVSKSMERLSSGLRINRAADDPAGLAISENLKSDIRALSVASRNAQDGISVVQTADGALDEISSILIRMKELTIQSLNGTYQNSDRRHLDDEFQALKAEMTRISRSTEFNGIHLLDGSGGTLSIQVGIGTDSSDSIDLNLGADFGAGGLNLGGHNIATLPGPSASPVMNDLESAMETLNKGRSQLGAVQNRLESAVRTNLNYLENLSAANSRIRDLDMAREMGQLTSSQILQQVGVSMLSQAMQLPNMALSLLG